MDAPSFADLWQQEEFSDVEVLLTAADATLSRFPGHNVILSRSPYFAAQALRWQRKRPHEESAAGECQPASTTRQGGSTQQGGQGGSNSRPQLVLELQDDSEQPIALTVLSAMYLVKPLPQLLADLSQEQQLQAAVLADKWQVASIKNAAARLLTDAASTEAGLTEAVKQRVLSAAALPECLQPLLKAVLLPLFGDLEAVWADAGLQEQLLGLPLPAMELLLSRDDLEVASEDTVLYTLRRYLGRLGTGNAAWQHARQVLAPLIRCPNLSQLWLSLAVVSTQTTLPDALDELRPQLGQQLLLRSAEPGVVVQQPHLQGLPEGAPPSWALGRRAGRLVASVSVTWDLNITTLREAAQRCVAEKKVQTLQTVSSTALLGGLPFTIFVQCKPHDAGCKVGIFATCANLLECSLRPTFRFQLVSGGQSKSCLCPARLEQQSATAKGHGWHDFFGLGIMAGGWDEAALAAKGLPSSGNLPITLTVSEVGHVERVPVQARAGQRR